MQEPDWNFRRVFGNYSDKYKHYKVNISYLRNTRMYTLYPDFDCSALYIHTDSSYLDDVETHLHLHLVGSREHKQTTPPVWNAFLHIMT